MRLGAQKLAYRRPGVPRLSPICAGLRLRVGHGGTAAYSPDRLDRDANRQRSKKAGLGQPRHRLYLGVAEPVVGVGELVGGKKGAAFAPGGQ